MNIFKIMIRLGVLAVTVCLYSACDSLDLAPIDSYGTGNYWKRPEHVQAYMDGLHKNLRDKIFQHQYTFGESRGGTSIVGTAVDGTSPVSGDETFFAPVIYPRFCPVMDTSARCILAALAHF